MGKFDTMTRQECVERLRFNRDIIKRVVRMRNSVKNDGGARTLISGTKLDGYTVWPLVPSITDELHLRNEAVELRARLLQIEVEERDACSIALQRATFEAEEKRGETS